MEPFNWWSLRGWDMFDRGLLSKEGKRNSRIDELIEPLFEDNFALLLALPGKRVDNSAGHSLL